MQQKLTFGTPQTQSILIINSDDIFTFASEGIGATDYVIKAEVQLTNLGTWFPVQNMVDKTVYSTSSGVHAIRFNLTDLGAASSVCVEITGASL